MNKLWVCFSIWKWNAVLRVAHPSEGLWIDGNGWVLYRNQLTLPAVCGRLLLSFQEARFQRTFDLYAMFGREIVWEQSWNDSLGILSSVSRNRNLRLLKQCNFGVSLLQREYMSMKIGRKLSRLLRWLRVPVLKLLQTERMLRNLLKESVIISHLQASPLYVCLQWKWDHLTEVSGELHLCAVDAIDSVDYFSVREEAVAALPIY